MLNKKRRGGRSLFLHPTQPSRRFNSNLLGVEIISLTPPKTPTRFAVVVGKKITPTAAARNLLKRRIYSAIEPISAKIKPGLGIIIFTKPPAASATFQNLQLELEKILNYA